MPKILIVEDVDLNVDLLIQLLEDDYELVIAVDGEEGVAKAATEHPDLILMDMSLPKMDGYQATRLIKTSPELNHTIIIGLSAHAMNDDAQRALDAGCDEYLTKPVDEDLLFQTLNNYLGA